MRSFFINFLFLFGFLKPFEILSQVNSAGTGAISENKPTPINYRNCFRYTFSEFKDKTKYDIAVNTIKEFSQYLKPPFEVKNAIYYNPSLQFQRIDTLLRKEKIYIDALRYYIDSKSFVKQTGQIILNTTLSYEYLYQPFYLRNSEVTNIEYREFINYVKDSISRTLLAKSKLKNAGDFGYIDDNTGHLVLKWNKKIDYESSNEEFRAVLEPIYFPVEGRFYNRRELDTRKLNYEFYTHNGDIKCIINIYPDTLVWVNDFSTRYPVGFSLEAHTDLYFWHPAYNNYPVVGITYKQAKAFLIWKTSKLQQELDSRKISLIVEYDLPNEIELAMISLLNEYKFRSFSEKQLAEKYFDYELDLLLNKSTNVISESGKYSNIKNYKEELYNQLFYKFRISKESIFTSNTQPEKNNKSKQDLGYIHFTEYGGIPFLNGNVSEWMSENLTNNDTLITKNDVGKIVKWREYLTNYSTTFPFRGNFEDSYKLYKIFSDSAKNYDINNLKKCFFNIERINNQNCKLIKGANWFEPGDYHIGELKKTFSSEDSTYSTVGFRYVVRFKKK